MAERTWSAAVDAAHEAGEWMDDKGQRWTRGVDGWFFWLPGDEGMVLVYHHEMADYIQQVEGKGSES